ncbi:hypothetical protein [Bacteroides cellulosilyticus]|uniref:hypothetical protein n=1 Tax=Bacteroides cellulosilyticus TaxID=246787 RepID=UPI001922EC88|nr:hypothetical protein [Bacteroides cellulosilyticus]
MQKSEEYYIFTPTFPNINRTTLAATKQHGIPTTQTSANLIKGETGKSSIINTQPTTITG